MDKRETNSDHAMEKKDNLQIFTVLRQLLFLEIVSVRKVKNKLII